MKNSLKKNPSLSTPLPGFICGKEVTGDILSEVSQFILKESSYKWMDKEGNITRATINFGWDYAAMEFGKYTFIPLPPCIERARKAIVHSFSESLASYIIPEYFDNIIISIYKEGQHLIAHYDADNCPSPITKRNFSFAEPILGWVIKADTESSLTFYYHTGEDRPSLDEDYIYKVNEQDGATFLIDKECRHFPYFHSIPPVKGCRISMTMRRTVLPEDTHVD